MGDIQRQRLDIPGGDKGGFQRRRVDTRCGERARGDLRGVDLYGSDRVGREDAGEDAVLVDVGRAGPLQAHGGAEDYLSGRSVVFDILVTVAQLHVAAVIHVKGLVAVFETVDSVDRLDGNRSRGGFRAEGKRAHGDTGDGAVAVFRAREKLGRDDRAVIDERLARVPLLHPVEQGGIGPVLARRAGLGLRPDERQVINHAGNQHGDIRRTVVGERGRAGGDDIGHGLRDIVDGYRREARRLVHRTEGEGRESLVAAGHPDGRGEGDGRENLPGGVGGEDILAERLGKGVPVLLHIDGRLSPGDGNL